MQYRKKYRHHNACSIEKGFQNCLEIRKRMHQIIGAELGGGGVDPPTQFGASASEIRKKYLMETEVNEQIKV